MNFGVIAAQALEERRVDGFWANGMGAEIAVRRGVGTVVIDARREPAAPNYTMACAVHGSTDRGTAGNRRGRGSCDAGAAGTR